jgi:hypothetical protein
MCGTFEASATTGVASWAVAAGLWASGDRTQQWLAAFIATFSSMQFVDAGIWATGDPAGALSRYAVLAVLLAEPWVNLWGLHRATGIRLPAFEVLLAVWCVGLAIGWLRTCERTTVSADGRLRWCGRGAAVPMWVKVMLFVMLAVPLAYFPDPVMRWVLLAIGAGTWALNVNDDAFGTKWCWSANAVSLVAALRYLL